MHRLGWAVGLSYLAHGVRVGLRATTTEALSLVQARLPCGWRPARSPVVDRLYSFVIPTKAAQSRVRHFNLVYRDSARLTRTLDLEDLLQAWEADARLYVAEHAPRRVFVHAGVVAWRGRAILLPGPSYVGKSTLVMELVRAGAVYYSDEYAVLDARGRVHPFAQPVALREPGEATQRMVTVESFGGVSGRSALPVGLVVLSRYAHGKRWRPRTLSPGQGVLALLANTVSAQRAPQAAVQALGQVVASARVIKTYRGEASEAAQHVLGAMGS